MDAVNGFTLGINVGVFLPPFVAFNRILSPIFGSEKYCALLEQNDLLHVANKIHAIMRLITIATDLISFTHMVCLPRNYKPKMNNAIKGCILGINASMHLPYLLKLIIYQGRELELLDQKHLASANPSYFVKHPLVKFYTFQMILLTSVNSFGTYLNCRKIYTKKDKKKDNWKSNLYQAIFLGVSLCYMYYNAGKALNRNFTYKKNI